MTHSPNTEQRERELFETKMLRLDVLDDEGLERRADGSYIDEPAQAAWAAWQARATQAAPASPEPAKPCGGCYGHGMVGNIIEQDVCPFCKGTGAEGIPDRAPASPNTGAVEEVTPELAAKREADRDAHYVRVAAETGVFSTMPQAVAFGRACLEWERVTAGHWQCLYETMRTVYESSASARERMQKFATPSPSKGGEADSAAEGG